MIKKIRELISRCRYEKAIKDFEDEFISEYETEDIEFVWGILSGDDLTGSSKANLFTMNDLDLIYHKNTKKYSLGVETIYMFTTQEARCGYMMSLLDEFTKWMQEKNYDTNKELGLYGVFTQGIDINSKFNSIEMAYAAFKMMVHGYCSLQKTN